MVEMCQLTIGGKLKVWLFFSPLLWSFRPSIHFGLITNNAEEEDLFLYQARLLPGLDQKLTEMLHNQLLALSFKNQFVGDLAHPC